MTSVVVVVKIAPSIARSPGKCQEKKQQKRHVGQGKQPGGFTKLCAGLLYKFKEIQHGVLYVFFFSMDKELRRVLLRNISMENFFPNSGNRVCSRKTCLNDVPL